jgi:5-methylcytosine-specific restriction enzyme A
VVALKITLEMSKGAYEIAKKVLSGQLFRIEGKFEINRVTGMNEGSAQAFITIFLAMMNGEEYKRAFNNETNKFLLESIRNDFGDEYYKNALNAVQKHINYYSTLGKGNLTGLQTIVNQKRKMD